MNMKTLKKAFESSQFYRGLAHASHAVTMEDSGGSTPVASVMRKARNSRPTIDQTLKVTGDLDTRNLRDIGRAYTCWSD